MTTCIRCKVCDRGVLVPRKMSRMSGPAVAIGYILLIPSILGMIGSTLIFFGVIAFTADRSSSVKNESAGSFQGGFDSISGVVAQTALRALTNRGPVHPHR